MLPRCCRYVLVSILIAQSALIFWLMYNLTTEPKQSLQQRDVITNVDIDIMEKPHPLTIKDIQPSEDPKPSTDIKPYWEMSKREVLIERTITTKRPLTEFEQAGNNIMITIRTTKSFHQKRLPYMYDTWLNKVNGSNVFLVTDGLDDEYQEKSKKLGIHYVVISCGKNYSRWSLCCKSGEEMALMHKPENKQYDWFCHLDDDIYIILRNLVDLLARFNPKTEPIYMGRAGSPWKNPRRVSKKQTLFKNSSAAFHFAVGGMYCLSRAMLDKVKPWLGNGELMGATCNKFMEPEDVSVGATVELLAKERLSRTHLFHPHGLILAKYVNPRTLKKQIGFAYGCGQLCGFKGYKKNAVKVPNPKFTYKNDPSSTAELFIYPHLVISIYAIIKPRIMARKNLEERQMEVLEQAGYPQEVEETQGALQRIQERSINNQIDEQERLNMRLFKAAQTGDVLKVRQCIINGADLNYHHPVYFGYTPLHQASNNGHLNIVQILTDAGCDTSVRDYNYQWSSLHFAASMGHFEIVQHLLKIMDKETITAVTEFGDTALHVACSNSHLHVIKLLLESGEISPLIRNSLSLTALEVIPSSCQHKTVTLKLFFPFISRNSNSFVLDAYAKVFICGNSGIGKSSLCHVVHQYFENILLGIHDECISDVVPWTAGIDVYTADLVCNRNKVNAVLYDFAGHPEYYSSHSAILENMLSSPAVFVILVKLTDTESAIKKQLYYWCNFIEDISITTSCQVIVVGSYADEASDDQVIRMKSVIDDVVQQAITRQSYRMFLAVDCHRTIGKGVKEFVSVLADTCEDVIGRSHLVSYFCCTHYSFICDLKEGEKVITVEDFCLRLKQQSDPSLPSEETTVIQSLNQMKYYNLILWLPDKENISKGWLIIDEKALLKEIIGVLFAPSAIGRVHCPHLSSNTGLISISTLASTFPSYDIHMLMGFLTTLQYCQVIKNETLKSIKTNICSSDKESITAEDVLFFPSLVSIERGNDVQINGHFSWSLYCFNPNKFFSNRFLHIVLLHLALNHSLRKRPRYGEIDERPPDAQHYDRQCHVWKNGIYWKDGSNEMEVEITDHNRCLTLLLSKCGNEKSLRIACTIISDILNLLKNHCSFSPHQYLISPHQLVNIHEVPINDRIVYSIQDIQKALDDEEEEVYDVNQDNPILITELFGGFDPKVVLACCMGCGDNPSTEKSKAPNHSELLYLLVPISAKWEHIGLALKVEHNIIDGLRRNEVDNTLRLSKILHAWINKDNNVTWDTIIQAIEGPIVDNKALVKEIMELKELSY